MRKIFLLFFLLLLLPRPVWAADTTLAKARILDVQLFTENGKETYAYTASIMEGPYSGSHIQGQFTPYDNTQYDFQIKKGMIVRVQLYVHDGDLYGDIVQVYRLHHIGILAIICAGAILLFGRGRGLGAIISLILSGLCIFFIYIPMVLHGYEILFATILCAVIIIVSGFLLIAGWTPKSLASMAGTLGGVVVAAILATIFSRAVSITGTTGEEVYRLVYEKGISLDFGDLFISGVIIGTIGVVMDVSMSVSSFIFELKHQSPSMHYGSLAASGLKVGKDIMATMVNTLILAYVGTSMPLLFLFVSASYTFPAALNLEIVSGEIIRSLSGTIGLVLTIPLTSLIAASIAYRSTPGKYHSRPVNNGYGLRPEK